MDEWIEDMEDTLDSLESMSEAKRAILFEDAMKTMNIKPRRSPQKPKTGK